MASAATLTVDDDRQECPAASFSSIQAAIDAATAADTPDLGQPDGRDTIAICPGEYAEGSGQPGTNALTITKNVILKGAGADLVRISPRASTPTGGQIMEPDPQSLRNGVGDVVAVVGSPSEPLNVDLSGLTIDGYAPGGKPVAVEAGLLFLDARGSVVRSRVTDVVTSEGDNAFTRPGGWRGTQPGIGIVQATNALQAPVDGTRFLKIERTRVDKYNRAGILIDAAQNDAPAFVASGAIDAGQISSSQVVGRTECTNFAGTGSCATVGLLTTGPLFGQDGIRITGGARAIISDSLVSQNLVNGFGTPTRSTVATSGTQTNQTANNVNLALGAGVRYVGAALGSFSSAGGQVVLSSISRSNITDNAYGVLNLAADGVTTNTGNPNANPVAASFGSLLKAENNWWGLSYFRSTNPGPAILPSGATAGQGTSGTTGPNANPPVPENPVGGTTGTTDAAASGSTGVTGPAGTTGPVLTSNSVDFQPYRSGQQGDGFNGEYAIAEAPIPINDQAPTVRLTGPATAAPGATITLTAAPADDIGVREVRFADGATTLTRVSTPPYATTATIPAGATCGSTRTLLATAVDSARQTATATLPVTVTCPTSPGTGGTTTTTTTTTTATDPPPASTPAAPADPPAATPSGPAGPPAIPTPLSVGAVSVSKAGLVTVTPAGGSGATRVVVSLGKRTVCTLVAAPFTCTLSYTGTDVGTQALITVVSDAAGSQVADVRSIGVPRFRPQGVSLRKKGKAIVGTLKLPAVVTKAQGCDSGSFTVVVKRRGRTISNRQVPMSSACTFTAAKALPRGATLTARFGGNAVLSALTATRRSS